MFKKTVLWVRILAFFTTKILPTMEDRHKKATKMVSSRTHYTFFWSSKIQQGSPPKKDPPDIIKIKTKIFTWNAIIVAISRRKTKKEEKKKK